jgi:tetratricopeptide (TPR) repeat protein
MLRDRGEQQDVPEQIQGPVFVSSEELGGSLWGEPEDRAPYAQFMKTRPSHVIAGEIAEYDGTFDVPKAAAVSHFIRASWLLKQGHADKAVAEAQQAVSLDPESLYAHEVLTDAYAANHQPDDAMREYETAMGMYATVNPEFNEDRRPPENPAPGGTAQRASN